MVDIRLLLYDAEGDHRDHDLTSRLWHRRFLILAPGKARAGQSDAGLAPAAGGDSDMGTAAAHGSTYAGQREVEMRTWHQFDAALKTEAHLFLMSSQTHYYS